MKAFVTDGNQRSALAVTRSLGRRGISVLVGEQEPVALASSSRYCAGHVTYPSPYRDPGGFQQFLLDFVRRERVDVVVPDTLPVKFSALYVPLTSFPDCVRFIENVSTPLAPP